MGGLSERLGLRDLLAESRAVPSLADAGSGPAHQILESAASVRLPEPLCLEGAIASGFLRRFMAQRLPAPTLLCARVEDVFVVGRGVVVDADSNVLVSEHLNFGPRELERGRWCPSIRPEVGGYAYQGEPRARSVDGPAALLTRHGFHIYGHWLLDLLPQIALFEAAGLEDLRWIVPVDAPAYVSEHLDLLSIGPERRIPFDTASEILHCPMLYLASPGRRGNVVSPFANRIYDRLLAAAGDDAPHPGPRRFFVSRRKWRNASRRVLEYDRVLERCAKLGIEEILPEEIPVAEQIRLFARAEVVVGDGGSGLHNTVFGSPALRVLVLQGRENRQFLQSSIGRIRGHGVGYLFGESMYRSGNAHVGDFLIDPQQLEDAIRRHLLDVAEGP